MHKRHIRLTQEISYRVKIYNPITEKRGQFIEHFCCQIYKAQTAKVFASNGNKMISSSNEYHRSNMHHQSSVDISAILVSFNTKHLIKKVMDHLESATHNLVVQTIFIDNASKDGSVELLRSQYPNCQLITNPKNIGFGRANNQALPYINGRYILLLNTDAFVSPETLVKTVAYLDANPQCGVVGVRLQGSDGILQPCARYFPTPWNTFLLCTGLNRVFKGVKMVDDVGFDHASIRECDWVPGCYYLIRREVIDTVGLFDPRFFLYSEEVDHCKRVKAAGWKVVYYPHTTVVHIGGESAKTVGAISTAGRQISALQIESELLFFRKHHGATGIALHMLLTTLGDAYLALKDLLKGRGPATGALHAKHARLTWRLALLTRGGQRPTR